MLVAVGEGEKSEAKLWRGWIAERAGGYPLDVRLKFNELYSTIILKSRSYRSNLLFYDF